MLWNVEHVACYTVFMVGERCDGMVFDQIFEVALKSKITESGRPIRRKETIYDFVISAIAAEYMFDTYFERPIPCFAHGVLQVTCFIQRVMWSRTILHKYCY
ncbi:hypothetical protein NPIL_306071 [Nephila pilipes]|uniref:Uncharacterized protein n=1 Tax=Nephila pilipes TaxID=299642 RepID=A0A8X6TBC8_NEPPI|nr:hypothetical protein NPIL_306071 [Nephila pilipes]